MTRCAALLALLLLPVASHLSARGHDHDDRTDKVLDLVQQRFLRELPRDTLETQALAAFLGQLDPYSTYLDADQLIQYERDLYGEFGGIGIVFGTDAADKIPYVQKFIPGSAAMAAGIRRGDQLLAIDGHALAGLDYDGVRSMLIGTPGSAVEMRVRRLDPAAVESLRITRKLVRFPSVRGLTNNANGDAVYTPDPTTGIGYVRIMAFDRHTPDELASALAQLTQAHARGLVLDLRDSIGGLMSAAVGSADMLLDRGRIVTELTRTQTRHYDATPGVLTDIPVVMLINAGTASSSEIFAGALTDNHRVATMGRRSFGKGRVQEVLKLGPGLGAIKLSTGTFQRPSGKTIDKHDVAPGSEVGIAPDQGLEIVVDAAQAESWTTHLLERDNAMLSMPIPGLPQDTTPDPEYERAVAELKRMLAARAH